MWSILSPLAITPGSRATRKSWAAVKLTENACLADPVRREAPEVRFWEITPIRVSHALIPRRRCRRAVAAAARLPIRRDNVLEEARRHHRSAGIIPPFTGFTVL